jgi:hypothetical protein
VKPGASKSETRSIFLVALFLVAHAPLGVLMHASETLATLHAVGVVVGGLVVALVHPRVVYGVYAAAYIVAADVFWRMNGAQVFWETSKYATVLLLLITGVRLRGSRPNVLGSVYFLLLLPSIVALDVSSATELRKALSFNLSGPLCLAVSVWFFSRASLTADEHRTLRWAMLAPIIGVALVAISVRGEVEVHYGTASNAAASGGFGPNQVSSMLGLGVLLALYAALDEGLPRLLRIGALLVTVLLGVQSALTFSRGGLYGAAAAIAVGVVMQSQRPREVLRWMVVAAGLVLVAEVLVIPRLMTETGGAIGERFSDTGTTGRTTMARNELRIFFENLPLGVGPGGGRDIRMEGKAQAAHTEYTRVLAEHGLFGLLSLLTLLVIGIQCVKSSTPGIHRSIVASSLVWAAVFMLHAGMRLAAPSFLFGLAAAGYVAERRTRTARAPAPAGGSMLDSPAA